MKKKFAKEKFATMLRKVGKGVILAVGVVVAGMAGMLWKMEVMAAQIVQVTEFGVVNEAEGIFARCVYQEFDGSSGMLQLYLEKMDGQGEFLPVSYVDLEMAGTDAVTAQTEPQKPEPGIYRAVLLVRSGEGMPVVRFRDSESFEVQFQSEAQGECAGNGICNHILMESVLQEATPSLDAVLAESCEICGQVFACWEVPNSAYRAFLDQAADAIRTAQPGDADVVTIMTDRWISFDRRVLEAMESRRDISVLVKYRYQGEEHQVLIPAGADVSALADENGFCGFCYLAQIFGEKFDE